MYFKISFSYCRKTLFLNFRISHGCCKDRAIGNSPVTFSRVCIFPRFQIINSKVDKIMVSGLDFFPAFPVTYPSPSSEAIHPIVLQVCPCLQFEIVTHRVITCLSFTILSLLLIALLLPVTTSISL